MRSNKAKDLTWRKPDLGGLIFFTLYYEKETIKKEDKKMEVLFVISGIMFVVGLIASLAMVLYQEHTWN